MDRRIVFILVALAVIVPMLLPVSLPVSISNPTQRLYDYIDRLPPDSNILLAFDYGPSSMPELSPMAKALLKQCFEKGIHVIGFTLIADATTLVDTLMTEAAAANGAVDGEDYVFLGFRPGATQVILGMGTDIPNIFDSDYNGTPIADIPMMAGIQNYDQIALLIDLASSSTTEAWITYANTEYNLQIAAGVTGVMISQMYPFLQTGQLVGLISGIMGAAEYESLIETPGQGMLRLNIASFVHLLIVVLVIIGNIIFFNQRRREA